MIATRTIIANIKAQEIALINAGDFPAIANAAAFAIDKNMEELGRRASKGDHVAFLFLRQLDEAING